MFPLSSHTDRNSSIPLPLDGPFGFIQSRPSEPPAEAGPSFADALKQAASPSREANRQADNQASRQETSDDPRDAQTESNSSAAVAAEQAKDASSDDAHEEEQVVADEDLVSEHVAENEDVTDEVAGKLESDPSSDSSTEEIPTELSTDIPAAIPVEESDESIDTEVETPVDVVGEDATVSGQALTETQVGSAEAEAKVQAEGVSVTDDAVGKVDLDAKQKQETVSESGPPETNAQSVDPVARQGSKTESTADVTSEQAETIDGAKSSGKLNATAESKPASSDVHEHAATVTSKSTTDLAEASSTVAIAGGPKVLESETPDAGEAGSARRRRTGKSKGQQADDKASPTIKVANKDETLMQRVQQLLDKSLDQSLANSELTEGSEKTSSDTQTRIDATGVKSADASSGTDAANSRWSSRLFTTMGKRGDDTTVPRGVDQTQIINRVAKAFDAARNRGGEVRLRLSPPELGALKLMIKVENGVMTAKVEAETQGARRVLLDNLHTLKERLAEQGMRIEQFDVDLPDPRGDQQGKDVGEQWRQQQKQKGNRQPETESTAESSGGTGSTSNRGSVNDRIIGNDQLNVTV